MHIPQTIHLYGSRRTTYSGLPGSTLHPSLQWLVYMPCLLFLLCACSTTKGVPDDDQLFTGLTKIDYQDYERNQNFLSTQEEVEAALATAPNGALFGSSYYRSPFPVSLWIWNAFSEKETGFARWMTKTFGSQPVLMSWVNPALRSSVARSVLRNHGYFRGWVDYETVPQKNPRKGKIGYTVHMNQLFTVDSFQYVGFPREADSLIRASEASACIRPGDAFTVEALDNERSRLTLLFRNNGYYYYQPTYATYLADTLSVPGKAQLRLQAAEDMPEEAMRKWYIGKVTVDVRRQFMQTLTDSLTFRRRAFKMRFSGHQPPVRRGVIMKALSLGHGAAYSHDQYLESVARLNGTGLFSMSDFTFTPRDNDTLDLALNCVLDKPYDFYIETNLKNKTSGRIGPELVLGLTKRNAFRGGELLDINLHGSYEWQRSSSATGSERLASYEYGIDASIEYPRLMMPWREWFNKSRQRRRRHAAAGQPMRAPTRYYATPTTLAKLSRTTLNRPDFFKMVTFSGEWTYRWQKTQTSRHELSPVSITYQHLVHKTHGFDSILSVNPYLMATMQDVFIPRVRYTYSYSSPATRRNPIVWTLTVSESGNLTALGHVLAGHSWNQGNKELFNTPFSQFLKVETDFSKTWRMTPSAQLVGHVSGGVIYSFGNTTEAPFSESFYVGGANSIRAFTMRSIGPGRFPGLQDAALSYLVQNGDMKVQANLEYRSRLFGNLQGALFLDAGNIWKIGRDHGDESFNEIFNGSSFKPGSFLRQMAVGTGVGLRYDLDFLVLRLDWGVGLHVPYDTGRSGFYNIRHFRDSQALHLAVGYPF